MVEALRIDPQDPTRLTEREPGVAYIGDEVMIAGGISWMRHGVLEEVLNQFQHGDFAMVRLRSEVTGDLLEERTLIPYRHLVTWGPMPVRHCAQCNKPEGEWGWDDTYEKHRRKYCSDACQKLNRKERRNGNKEQPRQV